MQATVTNPDPRHVRDQGGRKVDVTGPVDLKLNNGKVHISLDVATEGEYDLTGDQIGYLEAHGLQVACAERDAPAPPGSKKWRAAVAAKGLDADAELAKLTAPPKPAPARGAARPANSTAQTPPAPGA